MNRRIFLECTLAGGAAAVTAGLLRLRNAQAGEWPAAAFRARSVPEVLDQLFNTSDASSTPGVGVKAPSQSSGRAVPVRVMSRLKGVERMAIVVEGNVCPLSTLINMYRSSAGYFYSAYVEMAATSSVAAYVSAEGRLYSNLTTVKINVGGYGLHGELASEERTSVGAIATMLKARRHDNGKTDVRVMVKHPMSGGSVQRSSVACFSGHFIKTMMFFHNDMLVAEALLGPGVAMNPLTGIQLLNARAGDAVSVKWLDNKGQSGDSRIIVR